MHMIHDDFNIVPSKACCDWMKKKPFEAFAKENGYEGTLQGVRIQEGGARSTAAMKRIKAGSKLCTWIKHGVIQKAPIIDWSEDDVNAFIEKYNVPLSRAYTEFGFERTGCMACPYSRNLTHDLAYLFDYEPNRYKAAMFWLKDVYIAQNVVLPFDPEYERERERGHGKISTNL